MNLNLGCGYEKVDGFIGVDDDAECKPDVLHDLTVTPWPFETSSVNKVLLTHVLEHIGPTPREFLDFWKELYRVCKNGAEIQIEVPHWQHPNFFHDPTHVRPITAVTVALFDQKRNKDDLINNGRESKLGLRLGVDFSLEAVHHASDAYTSQIFTSSFLLKAIKPGRVKNG